MDLNHARSTSVNPICEAHIPYIWKTPATKISPIQGWSIRETGPPPRITAIQKSHGDQNAKPVNSK